MIQFRELKQYIARTVRISICFRDGQYDNYTMVSDIPDGKYDDMYVYGIGTADVEFSKDVYRRPFEAVPKKIRLNEGYYIGCGLEIVLQEEPRNILRQDEDVLHFCDVCGYLQTGMNFSVVMREDWTSEQYVWRDDIPKQYIDLYVYGIGLEDIPEKMRVTQYEGINVNNTKLLKQMVIVLAKTPRVDIYK